MKLEPGTKGNGSGQRHRHRHREECVCVCVRVAFLFLCRTFLRQVFSQAHSVLRETGVGVRRAEDSSLHPLMGPMYTPMYTCPSGAVQCEPLRGDPIQWLIGWMPFQRSLPVYSGWISLNSLTLTPPNRVRGTWSGWAGTTFCSDMEYLDPSHVHVSMNSLNYTMDSTAVATSSAAL